MGILRIRRLLDKILMSRGLKITKTGLGFMSASHVCRQAKLHNMSVADFIESEDAKKDPRHSGRRDRIVERILKTCSLQESARILEIGPGTARYMEKILHFSPDSDYEIYETAQDWVAYIKKTYSVRFRVKIQPPTGSPSLPPKQLPVTWLMPMVFLCICPTALLYLIWMRW